MLDTMKTRVNIENTTSVIMLNDDDEILYVRHDILANSQCLPCICIMSFYMFVSLYIQVRLSIFMVSACMNVCACIHQYMHMFISPQN